MSPLNQLQRIPNDRSTGGHAEHFLRRLDRVSRSYCETALSLYNDSALLKELLRRAGVAPEERVAISLHHPNKGPFVVVTGSAHFVTCLAEGMTFGGRVIRRDTLDNLRSEADQVRKDFKMASVAADAAGGVERLMGLLVRSADRLDRERFAAIAFWQPLLRDEPLVELMGDWDWLDTADKPLSLIKKYKPKYEPWLRELWLRPLANGHRLVLMAMSGAQWFPREWSTAGFLPSAVTTGGLRLAAVVRGAWAMAQVGPALLPSAEEVIAKSAHPASVLAATLALTALASKDPACAADVISLITDGLKHCKPMQLSGLADQVRKDIERTLTAPEAATARALEIGRSVLAIPSSEDSPFRRTAAKYVPDDVALLALANYPGMRLVEPDGALTMITAVAAVAGLPATDLYLPRGILADVQAVWSPQQRFDELKKHCFVGTHTEIAQPRVGRNTVCPCGSGKKHKRCCHGRLRTDRKVQCEADGAPPSPLVPLHARGGQGP